MIPSSEDTSSELAKFADRIARRESSILHMLFDAFAPPLYGKIISVVKEPDRAARILEKTFLYAVKYIQQHNPRLRLHSWFLQIANFKMLEEAANTVTGKTLSDDLEPEHYAEAWCRLNAYEKEVLEWSILKGICHEEMAAQLDLPLEMLQLRISTALTLFHHLITTAGCLPE
jgi:RNA polymerase sigma-70 factor (ECF subfamily)